MHVKLNKKSEIISYAIAGNINNSVEIEKQNISESFEDDFKPSYFVFEDGKIRLNKNYQQPKDLVVDELISIKDIIVMNEELLIKNAGLMNRIEKLENKESV
ncbi:DUF2977 domain-containing protein [Brochothrix thermosphacta]|uniref:DUF2977 domain-containing protein n=1 Tax=Brochothrix thermosphacta TaxID=2756 RepID=UPI000D795EC6|nr:DUF2977 domain-containing protein [Brochothrix thermosphacta]SPN75211.1 hypothetical protein BTEBP_20010 [Brochothrix thermosphacta]